MKIIQIAPFSFAIGNNMRYGGIERVVNDLDKGFTSNNENSYVIATGDSQIKGTLCPTFKEGLWKPQEDKMTGWKYERGKFDYELKLEEHSKMALDHIMDIKPDIVHDHAGFIKTEVFKKFLNKHNNFPPILHTPHDRFNPETIIELMGIKEMSPKKIFFNAVSLSQKKDYEKFIPIDFMVYNGVDLDSYLPSFKGKGFALALGLINFLKGSDIVLKVAKETGKKLIMAGPILTGNPNQKKSLGAIGDFWERQIKPNIDLIVGEEISPHQVEDFVNFFMKSKNQIAYAGELNNLQKVEFYKRADVSLHPARVNEAFGLFLVESMACGTPVIAYDRGAIPEVIRHKKTGYIVDSEEINNNEIKNFSSYLPKINKISRKECRKHVEDNFSIERQIKGYLNVYKKMLNN